MWESGPAFPPALWGAVPRGTQCYFDMINAEGGIHGRKITLLPDSQHPLMKKYKKAQEKFAPKERWGIFFYAGFGFVEVMVEGLKRCGRALTVENFVKAMESIKDFQGIGPKISFGPNQRQGIRACFLARCTEDGKIERLSDWMRSDLDVLKMVRALWK